MEVSAVEPLQNGVCRYRSTRARGAALENLAIVRLSDRDDPRTINSADRVTTLGFLTIDALSLMES